MIRYATADTRDLLEQILGLQSENLSDRVSPGEALEQGFVTVRHDLPLLECLSGRFRHVVALEDHRVVGYALVMLKEFGHRVPVLVPLFDQIDQLPYGLRRLCDAGYFVMGQVCIEKAFRGRGIFKGLYDELRNQMKSEFELVVTEIASRNIRSLKAHEKVGFRRVHRYTSPEGESWEVVVWDWR